ncbi:MAG: hypothetical protein M1833_003841 [Piccolia ochrophora]|nr:MAG: hypothetical protein M1833_003841 [Piccolia ochrophora]
MDFIKHFVSIITAAVRSLDVLTCLTFLRVRYIDLDSPAPLLNPYFQLYGEWCTGIWTEELLSLLSSTRPGACYLDLSDSYPEREPRGQAYHSGASTTRRRPLAIKASSYAAIHNNGPP